ncbi:CoA-acylating methylmalonate-semialdehyde dehydrogenase, partial [Nocardia sp. NPDC003963]
MHHVPRLVAEFRHIGSRATALTRRRRPPRNRADRRRLGQRGAIPVPIAYYTFGGWKRSGFGDLNQH